MSRLAVVLIAWLLLSVPVAILLGKVFREGRTAAPRLRRGDAGRAATRFVHGNHGRRQGGAPRVPAGRCPMGLDGAGGSREATVALGHSRPPHLTSCPFGRRPQPTRRPRTRRWKR